MNLSKKSPLLYSEYCKEQAIWLQQKGITYSNHYAILGFYLQYLSIYQINDFLRIAIETYRAKIYDYNNTTYHNSGPYKKYLFSQEVNKNIVQIIDYFVNNYN